MIIYYFRMSLKATGQDSLFELPKTGRLYNREEWIREYFSRQRVFLHRGMEFRFVPEKSGDSSLPHHLLFGWIARSLELQERTPPTQGFEPTQHSSWRGALLIIDPTEHADGQKIGFEQRADVGKPAALLRSLASQIRLEGDARPFDVSIFPIAQEASFWKFAEQHGYQINLIRFNVVPPNMFGGADEFSRELKALRDRNNVNRVNVTLTSDGVIDAREENIKQVVDYTERGVGDILARTTSNARYSSRNHIRHDTLEGESTAPDFWARVAAWLSGRF